MPTSGVRQTMLNYAVIGTGAIGGYYGGRLAESGKNVQFLARSDAEYLKKKRIKSLLTSGRFPSERNLGFSINSGDASGRRGYRLAEKPHQTNYCRPYSLPSSRRVPPFF